MKKILLVVLIMATLTLGPGFSDEVEEQAAQALETYRSGDIPGSIDQFIQLLVHLQNQLELNIRNLHLCYSIEDFGVYNKMDSRELKSGQPLLLYLEIEGYGVKREGDRYWIHVSEDMTIKSKDGEILIQRENFLTYHKYFLVPIVPFYLENKVTSIPPGQYTYHLTLRDHTREVTVTREFDFSVL